MIFIIIQDTLYVAGRLTANENHTFWFLIFQLFLLKVPAGGNAAVYVIDS